MEKSKCLGPGRNWERCFRCPFEDCICDVVTPWEKKESQRLDVLFAHLTGYKTEQYFKNAERYKKNKEKAKEYYKQNREKRLSYYYKNRERLKEKALRRYYEKVKQLT